MAKITRNTPPPVEDTFTVELTAREFALLRVLLGDSSCGFADDLFREFEAVMPRLAADEIISGY